MPIMLPLLLLLTLLVTITLYMCIYRYIHIHCYTNRNLPQELGEAARGASWNFRALERLYKHFALQGGLQLTRVLIHCTIYYTILYDTVPCHFQTIF